MKLIAWNCQGIGSPLTVKALMELKKRYDPQFFFLVETKNKEEKLEIVRRKAKFDMACYVDSEGLSGGLALWWKEQDGVRIIGKCKNLIDMEVNEESVDQQFRVFWVYGLTDFDERQGVWKMISERARTIKVS